MRRHASIVIPVYRSAGRIPTIATDFADAAERLHGWDLDLVMIDDASGDATWPALVAATQGDDRITAIRLAANVRQLATTIAGFSRARGEVLVVLDADVEGLPAVVEALLHRIERGHDLVAIQRLGRNDGQLRALGSLTMNLLGRAIRTPTSDLGSALLAMERPIAEVVRTSYEATGVQLLLPDMFRAASSPTVVPMAQRNDDPSGYPLPTLLRTAWIFVRARLSVPIGRVLFLSGAVASVSCRGRRHPLSVGLALSVVGAVLATGAARPRRDPRRPVYEVAEEIRGVGARSTSSSRTHESESPGHSGQRGPSEPGRAVREPTARAARSSRTYPPRSSEPHR